MAILLPFDHQQQPLDHFAEPKIVDIERDHQYDMNFRMTTHGRAFRVQHLVDQTGESTDLPFAVLRWNPDEAKLVIMDGQHRAMSLLAIERTVTKSWHTAPKGARYQPFYEEHVQNWLDKAKQENTSLDLSQIELPVTICWFPEVPGQQPRPKPHRAARKLFVDVNNTAKPPSEARLVLLSDTELQNILARELLNQLRCDEQWHRRFPLFGVEYDNPVKAVTTPRRWSVVTNLEILKDSVLRTLFGPPKLIENAKATLQGKPNAREMNKLMRDQLEVGKLFPKEFHDGPHRISRDSLSNEIFPINDDALHKKILTAFYERWGKGILHLICEILPYKEHLTALNNRYTGWTAADNVQTLAKDALFEGVGMFWTIEDGHQLWLDDKKDAQDNQKPLPPQPDISRAWSILDEEQKRLFQCLRAKTYLGTDVGDEVKDSERLYQGLITYAAQVGLVLAWVSIHRIATNNAVPLSLAIAFSSAINDTLQSGPTNNRDRRKILLRSSCIEGFRALNELPKLEPAYATHYRYFWLELLLQKDNHLALEHAGIKLGEAIKFLTQCRRSYIELLIDERRKERLKDAEIQRLTEGREEKAKKMAYDEIVESQAQAHHYWFGGSIGECRKMIKDTLVVTDSGLTSDEDDYNIEGDNDEIEEVTI